MLTKITYKNKTDIPTLREEPSSPNLVTFFNDEESQQLHLSYGDNLTFKEYKEIHHLILKLNNLLDGEIDDSGSLLGYLQNGDGAYIVHQWKAWCTFLFQARLQTISGNNVQVTDEEGYILANGILLSYVVDESNEQEFIITSCTLITSTGEEIIGGDSLEIEAIKRW